jgi:hypothetical protein
MKLVTVPMSSRKRSGLSHEVEVTEGIRIDVDIQIEL